MPAGFGFPINHRYWVPLHLDPTAYDVGGGPAIRMFGRLAPGVDLAQAQAELSTVGQRMARENPATHEHLRPRVLHYPRAYMGIDNPSRAWMARTAQLVLSLLLVVVAVNVAILVYARTSARMGEITVRSALGASRRRVVTQLFAEALVLSLIAAVIGQSLVFIGFSWFEQRVLQGDTMGLPFWVELGLSPVLETASTAEDERQQSLLFLALLVVAVTGSVLLLSAAGVYAMMSFTVASRRREIGIRSALGAAPERVLRGVFKRAGMQLAGGAVGGLLLAEAIGRLLGVSLFRGEYAHLPPTVALLVTAIGLLAAWGPARLGLSVPPTEALRGE
jgi:ABC-type antimicrobial peptide transport system permease subunit